MQVASIRHSHRVIRLSSLFASIRETFHHHGPAPTLADLALWAFNHVVRFKVLRCLHVGVVDPAYLRTSGRYWSGFLDGAVLTQYCLEEYELSEEFLRTALARGDQCFGILDDGVLANYGWYSNLSTDISEELQIHVDRRYMYMYKGFTHPRYRGQRLFAVGMTMALQHYLARGFKGLVCYVESTNFSSLKSMFRMGYRRIGSIYVVKAFGRYVIHCTRGCRSYGVGLEPAVRRPRQTLSQEKLTLKGSV